MGNQQSSQYTISKCLYLTVSLDERLQKWKIMFSIILSRFGNFIEINNEFDTLYFDKKPVRFNLTNHENPKLKHIKKIQIFFDDDSENSYWISIDESNPQTFQVLPVARMGKRLQNHQSKFYTCEPVEGTTTSWLITVYQVRDIDGNLEILSPDVEIALFSTGCRITDRITIDTGSVLVPNLEYNIASNKIQLFYPIKIVMIYQLYSELINPRIIQNNSQLILT